MLYEAVQSIKGRGNVAESRSLSVRVQGMNRQHHISLREEFDGHDGDESKYIVLLDDKLVNES